MEPAGVAIGVLSIAGLFNNAIDCFKYTQLSRNFGKDFQTSLLKLDIARLRLSRWGQSVGLSGDFQHVQSLDRTLGSEDGVKKAEEVLGHILELFAQAERVSIELKEKATPGTTDLQVCDPQRDLSPAMGSLHTRMRDLSLQRQNRTSLRQKSKWALYKEEDFKKLIGQVTDLTGDLIELFPAAEPIRKQICQDELAEISESALGDNLAAIRNLAAGQDADLEVAVSNAIRSPGNAREATKNTWNNADNTKVGQQLGQQNVYGGLNFY